MVLTVVTSHNEDSVYIIIIKYKKLTTSTTGGCEQVLMRPWYTEEEGHDIIKPHPLTHLLTNLCQKCF